MSKRKAIFNEKQLTYEKVHTTIDFGQFLQEKLQ